MGGAYDDELAAVGEEVGQGEGFFGAAGVEAREGVGLADLDEGEGAALSRERVGCPRVCFLLLQEREAGGEVGGRADDGSGCHGWVGGAGMR